MRDPHLKTMLKEMGESRGRNAGLFTSVVLDTFFDIGGTIHDNEDGSSGGPISDIYEPGDDGHNEYHRVRPASTKAESSGVGASPESPAV